MKVENDPPDSLVRQGWTHVFAGFLLIGSWAAFANRAYGIEAVLQAGLVQGTVTAIITLGMKKSIDAISGRLRRTGRKLASLLVPPLAVCTVSICLLTGLHTLAGTPELVGTIVVPFTVSFAYACLYAFHVWRAETKVAQ